MKVCKLKEHYSFLRISGPKTKDFLNGQLSCNIVNLEKGKPTYCSYVNVKGKVSSFFIIFFYEEDQYIIFLPKSLLHSFIKDLSKYIMFLKIKIENVSQEWSSLAILNFNVKNDNVIKFDLVKFFNNSILFLFGLKKNMDNFVNNILKHINYYSLSEEEYKYVNIISGNFELNAKTIDKFLPNNLNLIKFVDFSKGCFRGQEIILRVKNFSSPKKALSLLLVKNKILDIDYEKIERTIDQKIVGRVVDYVFFKGKTYILSSIDLNLEKDINLSIKSTSDICLLQYF